MRTARMLAGMTQEQTRKRAKTAILKMLAAAEEYFEAEATLQKQRERPGTEASAKDGQPREGVAR